MSYTKAQDDNNWMDRLPRIQSRSKSQMSRGSETDFDEKIPPGTLPTNFLRRQREEDNPSRAHSRSNSKDRTRKRKTWESGQGPGGPISQSAIAPQPRISEPEGRSDSDTLAQDSSSEERQRAPGRGRTLSPGEIYEEGDQTVYEDEEGNVLAVEPSRGGGKARRESEIQEGRRLMRQEGADKNRGVAPTKDDPNEDTGHEIAEKFGMAQAPDSKQGQEAGETAPERPGRAWREGLRKMSTAGLLRKGHAGDEGEQAAPKPEKKHGPARAYQFGNTIIVEDEDGEVIKKYDIPAPEGKQGDKGATATKARLGAMGKMLGMGPKESGAAAAGGAGKGRQPSAAGPSGQSAAGEPADDDIDLRFTTGGRRMSKAEFINSIRDMDPKRRVQAVEQSNAPESVKQEARKEVRDRAALQRNGTTSNVPVVAEQPEREEQEDGMAALRQINSGESQNDGLHLVDTAGREVPVHDVASDLKNYTMSSPIGETAAQRRRRQIHDSLPNALAEDEDSEDDGTERVPPSARLGGSSSGNKGFGDRSGSAADETAAERRRREGALGIKRGDEESDSDEDEMPRQPPPAKQKASGSGNIRFADSSMPATPTQGTSRQSTLKWGKDVR